ncbi:heterocyst formation ABC transporter subunit HepA [cf. Phormidesmis sp. LEGE 11477]|uniref:heterocyst formation ABC transporter subunit HepA n=1 Tax=cf. Phormidesmis sp. LEGE 11477 TaxID=1828680 RepID=UPI001882599A|nr:heterocyst formation ABC transporter subunit HepA [cf. Phormidesmis sp. LEGE 11477]MBE9061266.1 ABC transporter ATP-binding protein [cf. Phormidesmis sp. LEGE 11477]
MRLRLPRIAKSVVKATSFWKENRLILREFRHFRRVAVLAVVFALIAAFFEGVTVGFIASFLQGLTNPEEPPIQTGLAWFDTVVLATEAPAAERLYRLSGLLLVGVCMKAGFDYLGSVYSKRASLSLVDQLRQRIFDQLESLSLSFYSTANPGALISTVRGEVNQVQRAFNVLSTFIVHGSKLLAYLISMLLLSWQLFVTSVLVFGLMSVGLTSLTARVREASFKVPKANKKFTSSALSFISGIRTVHASGTQKFERQRYYAATREVYRAQFSLIKLSSLVQPIVEVLGVILLVGMVVVSYSLLISTGRLRAAELLTFLFVLIRTTPLVSSLNNVRVTFISSQGSLAAVSELLQRDDKPYFVDGQKLFTGLQRSIDFESVDFSYVLGEPVLHDITLSIKRGETTALVGSSGAGKTTLADLLPRFYDPTRGRVIVDGVDLRELKINSLRQKMAIVSQDTFIFNTTVRENIVYGVDRATDQDIYEATRMANALDFVLDLPLGFETVLGDRGVRLSGGQRQRIAIARALLRNPEILILDEATSALDSVTENLIQESLEKLSKGRTVIAIAHRLSTISGADKVVVMEKGRIVEVGRYQDLLRARGGLWKYHQMQHSLELA